MATVMQHSPFASGKDVGGAAVDARVRRRAFLSKTLEASLWLTVPALISSCGERKGQDPIASARAAGIDKPILLAIVAGIGAPNPHNTQAWRFRIHSDLEMSLYVDPERLLPATDPSSRQVHIGQGTFLEHLDLGARELGCQARIELLPEGEYGASEIGKKPVARVALEPDQAASRDPLWAAVPHRTTNRASYEGPYLTEAECGRILALAAPRHARAEYSADPGRLGSIGETLIQAFAVETNTHRTYDETLRWFRFSDEEISSFRDGLSLPSNATSGLKRFLAEKFLISRENWHSDKNRKVAIDLFRDQVGSARALVWLSTSENTMRDWVLVGRDYARLQLAVTSLGLAMHPMSQALQEYAEMADLRTRLGAELRTHPGQTVQMLARLGRSSYAYKSPRRPIAAMIIT
jgi:hypothetical protein